MTGQGDSSLQSAGFAPIPLLFDLKLQVAEILLHGFNVGVFLANDS